VGGGKGYSCASLTEGLKKNMIEQKGDNTSSAPLGVDWPTPFPREPFEENIASENCVPEEEGGAVQA